MTNPAGFFSRPYALGRGDTSVGTRPDESRGRSVMIGEADSLAVRLGETCPNTLAVHVTVNHRLLPPDNSAVEFADQA